MTRRSHTAAASTTKKKQAKVLRLQKSKSSILIEVINEPGGRDCEALIIPLLAHISKLKINE